MTVKSEVNHVSKKSFPKMMKGNFELVVLFERAGKGVVVTSGSSPYEVGHFSISWAMDSFKEFNEKITLENI